MGIRMLVTLSPDTLILPEKTGTKTITGGNLSKYGGNQTYNCWKIVTDEDEIVETPLVGVSDGKHNTSKEQILDLGKIDIISPTIEKVSSDVDTTAQTATYIFNVSDKYLSTTADINTGNISVSIDGTTSSSVTKTITRIPENDVTETIDGADRIVSKQYKLTISGFSQDVKQIKIKFADGVIKDANGNSNKNLEIAIYNVLKDTENEFWREYGFLGNNNFQRQNIENVTFESNIPQSVYNSITGEYVDTTAWDVSALQDKSIIAWYETSNDQGALKVHIGSNDEIFANQSARYLFTDIGYADICTATETITNINLLNVSNVTDMYCMFNNTGFKSMTSLDLGDNFNTSKVTNMEGMFGSMGYYKMKTLNLGNNFNTSNVTNMRSMFSDTGSVLLESLDLGDKFDTSNVTNMSFMFYRTGRDKMTSLNLGDKFDTKNVTNMSNMFAVILHITELNLGDKFDTRNVTDMSFMFDHTGYDIMKSLDLGDKFDTRNVTNMSNMFNQTGYTAMTNLNLRDKFDTSNVTNMNGMFMETGTTAMTSLNLGDKFNTSNATDMSYMFNDTGKESMTSLDLGPAFTKIAENNTEMFNRTGTDGLVIYAPESIYKSKTSFKLSSIDTTTAEGTIAVTNRTGVTIEPKYKPEWTLEGTSVDTANKALKINIKGATKADNYTSEVTTALSVEDISIWIDGEEVTGLSKAITTANPSTGASVTQTITLTNFEEAFRQAGKRYKEWSGNITLKIAGRGESTDTYTANTLTDSYGNQSMSATDETGTWIDIEFKDETTSSANEDGKMFTDFITPEFTYEYANTVIDHDTKTVTVVFDITDKYFSTSSLAEDSTASKIKVNFEGKEATNATKALTKLSDITATVNGVENTKVGEKYQLVVSNLDQGQGGDYSGIMTLGFQSGIATDLSNNSSLAKTITIGVDEPKEDVTGVKPSELFDSTGSNTEKLHIGDFINYDAGTWTQEEINSVKTGLKTDLQTANGSTNLPYKAFQFGGFAEGSSRNESVESEDSQYNYIKDKATGNGVTGWRVFDIDGDKVTLVSAGNPEAYYQWYNDNDAYVTEYMLTGEIDANWGNGETEKDKYQRRNWDTYINKKQNAINAIPLTKTRLDEWYTKYTNTQNANTYSRDTFQKIYKEPYIKYQNIIDNYSTYNIVTPDNSKATYFVAPYDNGYLSFGNTRPYGIRMLITLSSDVLLSAEKTGTKTLTGGNMDTYGGEQTYNCWDIVEKDQPVIVDVVDPIWKVENINIDQENQKVTAEVIATDKYLTGVENSTLTTDDIIVSVDGDNNANNIITKTLSTPTFSENAETGLKEIKYTLTLENWEESAKQSGKSFYEYSGLAKITIKEGTITDDTSGENSSNNSRPSELFDKDGSNSNGLHIGDFVDYNAGTWTQDDISSIKTGLKTNLKTATGSADAYIDGFQFGGFEAGSSRNENASPSALGGGRYNYIKDEATGNGAIGWRVFDVNGDNITLISTGDTEKYQHPNGEKYAYISEYILTGNISSEWGTSEAEKYQKRDWSIYINQEQKAENAIPLTKTALDNWYTKYIGTENADVYNEETFKKIYNEPYIKYQNIIDNYSEYWLASYSSKGYHVDLDEFSVYNKKLVTSSMIEAGIRMLVTLSSDVQLKSTKTGTKTLTGGNMDTYGGNQTYNCWSIVKDEETTGISDGKHNTSKEQTFELGHVDFVKPNFTYKYANTEINHDTKTVTILFDVADKFFNESSLSSDTVASNIKVNFEGKEATNATKVLTKLSDITETVNGVENTKVGEKYQLVVSNLDQGNGGDYSGIMTLGFNEGLITDTAGNGNVAKVITIGVDEPRTSKKPSELFDKNGSNVNGLHIGDFVNYDAGTWTQEEIDSIKTGLKTDLQTANGSTDLPANPFQFGGFTAGSSRNESVKPAYDNKYTYIKDASTGNGVTGWRVFDIDGDTVTLVSAGNPEDYKVNTGAVAFASEYVLMGTVNNNWSTGDTDKENYQKRDWGLYINKEQKATSAGPLTLARLNDWYIKYTDTANADISNTETFQVIYQEPYKKYQNIIENYSYYWVGQSANNYSLRYISPKERRAERIDGIIIWS